MILLELVKTTPIFLINFLLETTNTETYLKLEKTHVHNRT